MWTSKTRRFPHPEMVALELSPVSHIAATLRRSDPIVVLRALAEMLLNNGHDRVKELIADRHIWARWQGFTDDPDVEPADHQYAAQLQAFKAKQPH